jgi:AcrR family transcriptional regulator
MGSQPTHQQRRRDLTRERIMETALELASADGWASLTMRRIADRLQYTHPALYAYFATKEDLLLALLRQGLQLLQADLEAARAAAPDPEAALFAIADAYWSFAWRRPELYQVMHGLGGVAFISPEVRAEERQIGEPVAAAISAFLRHHGREPVDVDRKVVLLWSTLHGLTTLTMMGRFTQDEAAQLTQQMVRDAIAAWDIR